MNLNKYKKGFTKIRPERGLKNLVGAQKTELRDKPPETVRVTGTYIPGHKETRVAGRVLGIISFLISVIAGGLMLLAVILPNLDTPHPLGSFTLGFLLVHGCVMLADGLQNSDAPWARKAVIIFWSSTVLTFVISLVI